MHQAAGDTANAGARDARVNSYPRAGLSVRQTDRILTSQSGSGSIVARIIADRLPQASDSARSITGIIAPNRFRPPDGYTVLSYSHRCGFRRSCDNALWDPVKDDPRAGHARRECAEHSVVHPSLPVTGQGPARWPKAKPGALNYGSGSADYRILRPSVQFSRQCQYRGHPLPRRRTRAGVAWATFRLCSHQRAGAAGMKSSLRALAVASAKPSALVLPADSGVGGLGGLRSGYSARRVHAGGRRAESHRAFQPGAR